MTNLTYTWNCSDKASMQSCKEFQFCGQLKHHSSKQLAYYVGHVMCISHVYDICNFLMLSSSGLEGFFPN